MNYDDITKIINVLASDDSVSDDEFRRYKSLILKMSKYAERYMEENSQ
tara:strand:+ start:1107 stop:1250 length:144 start_codon:yes stop_codon:yes gene_type:complete